MEPELSEQRTRLSAQVRGLSEACRDREVTLGEVSELLKGRGLYLFLVLLGLPFCVPMPPGLSTPFGGAIVLLGLRLLFRQSDTLPRSLSAHRVPAKFFPTLLKAAAAMLAFLEVLMAPRLRALMEQDLIRRTAGFIIVICGALLFLPLPIPFTNVLPAFTVVLLACALVESDALTALVGVIFFILTLAFFWLILIFGKTAVDLVWEYLKKLFTAA